MHGRGNALEFPRVAIRGPNVGALPVQSSTEKLKYHQEKQSIPSRNAEGGSTSPRNLQKQKKTMQFETQNHVLFTKLIVPQGDQCLQIVAQIYFILLIGMHQTFDHSY